MRGVDGRFEVEGVALCKLRSWIGHLCHLSGTTEQGTEGGGVGRGLMVSMSLRMPHQLEREPDTDR